MRLKEQGAQGLLGFRKHFRNPEGMLHVGRLCPGRYWDKLPMDGAPDGRHDQLPEKVTSGRTDVTVTTKGDGEI